MPLMKWASLVPIVAELLIHIPNERKCSSHYGAILKRLGVKPFVSDLFLIYPTGRYAGFWIELKAPGKRPNIGQLNFLARMKKLGYAAEWYDNWERAREGILKYVNGEF